MEDDQDLLDMFALGAMIHQAKGSMTDGEYADRCWSIALAMKKARDLIVQRIEAQEACVPLTSHIGEPDDLH